MTRKEKPVEKETREGRIAARMAARIRESNRLAAEYESTLDPRHLELEGPNPQSSKPPSKNI
jgi:hypothetical protein